MSEEQYEYAEEALVSRLQTMREAECGARSLLPGSAGGDDKHSMDDVYDQPVSSEHQAAYNEWINYCMTVKVGKAYPKFKKEGLISIGAIEYGIVEERGADLKASHPFKQCNIADFFDDTGYFNLINFLQFNQRVFPYIYKLACCLASLRTNEVGCERFFSIAGYVSNPRRTRLNVRHYETIATLKRNMQQVYINEDWVVNRYMEKVRNKDWNDNETADDNLVASLEQEIYDNELGITTMAVEHIDDSDSGSSSNSDTEDEDEGT
jgi:hAT family C-terminal dimerisation region